MKLTLAICVFLTLSSGVRSDNDYIKDILAFCLQNRIEVTKVKSNKISIYFLDNNSFFSLNLKQIEKYTFGSNKVAIDSLIFLDNKLNLRQYKIVIKNGLTIHDLYSSFVSYPSHNYIYAIDTIAWELFESLGYIRIEDYLFKKE